MPWLIFNYILLITITISMNILTHHLDDQALPDFQTRLLIHHFIFFKVIFQPDDDFFKFKAALKPDLFEVVLQIEFFKTNNCIVLYYHNIIIKKLQN